MTESIQKGKDSTLQYRQPLPTLGLASSPSVSPVMDTTRTNFHPIPMQIDVLSDNSNAVKDNKHRRRSSSLPIETTEEDSLTNPRHYRTNDGDDDSERLHPRVKARRRSRSVRFSPEPPEIYEYPAATEDSKPEPVSQRQGSVLALPWHTTSTTNV